MYSNTLDADSSGWNGYTLVMRFETALLTMPSGSITQVRFKFEGGAAEGMDISSAYVGHAAGTGDAYDFAATPVQLLWAGSGSKSIGAGATATTDWASFAYNKTSALLVALYSGAAADTFRKRDSVTNATLYYKNANEPATVDKTGYSSSATTLIGINKIEADGF